MSLLDRVREAEVIAPDGDSITQWVPFVQVDASDRDQLVRALTALQEIAGFQPKVLEMIRRNGFVFERENLGSEKGNWSHLAFTLYSTICEIDLIAGSALK